MKNPSDTELINWLEKNPMLVGITDDGEWQAAYQGNGRPLARRAKTWRETITAVMREVPNAPDQGRRASASKQP